MSFTLNIQTFRRRYFRSKEIKALRDEADIIVTNPPFSLFREFLTWLVESGKQFSIIGNVNAISYKEVFPLIKDNKNTNYVKERLHPFRMTKLRSLT